MTVLDLIAILVVLAYAVLGWYSGTIRRVIGLVGVYVALLLATNIGQYAGGILRQYNPTISIPDARLIGWLFFLVVLILIFEGAATAIHTQLQLSVVALNRGIGVLLGLLTSVVLLTAVTYMLIGYANGQAGQSTSTQVWARDQLQHSAVLLPMVKGVGIYILPLLAGALPRDSQAYFIFQSTSS